MALEPGGRGEYNGEVLPQNGNSWPFKINILLKRYLPLEMVKDDAYESKGKVRRENVKDVLPNN